MCILTSASFIEALKKEPRWYMEPQASKQASKKVASQSYQSSSVTGSRGF